MRDDFPPHAAQRRRLAENGTPWASLEPALRYGTLLLGGEELHCRLRVPPSPAAAAALEAAVFDHMAWDDGLGVDHQVVV